jgi:hypothetical protein
VVWKGKYDGKDVAIKSMMTDINGNNRIKFIEMFVAEAKIMMIQKHARIGLSLFLINKSSTWTWTSALTPSSWN